jgi:hypothetical protein
LVKEVLDELFFERPGCKETVEIGAEKLGDEISGGVSEMKGREGKNGEYKSSRGEIKTSLRLMICKSGQEWGGGERGDGTHVLVLNVLEEFELSVGSFAEDGGAERLHDLLYRDRSACELVLGGTREWWVAGHRRGRDGYQTRPNAPEGSERWDKERRRDRPMPTGWRSTYLVVT